MENNLKVIEQKSSNALVTANKWEIIGQASYDKIADFLRSIKDLKKEVDSAFDDNIKSAHQLHKDLVATKKIFYSPLDQAERVLKTKIKDYEKEMEQKRLKAEKDVREKAEIEANKEREKLQSEGENKLFDGKETEGKELLSQAEQVEAEPDIVAPTIEKQKGLGIRDNWKFEVFDMTLLPRTFLIPDMKKIGMTVRALKKDTNIPGVKVWLE